MEKIVIEVLKQIYSVTKNTKDGWVPCIDIALQGQERKYVIEELKRAGMISDVRFVGKTKVQCKLTEKGQVYCMEMFTN